ncbi:MAG TPA: GH3 auxin-responsive promoter family protein [Balneolaceae bacterium]|nr:GH3 auxin-responsive promoter family protein [Balneolaceae bacterium]
MKIRSIQEKQLFNLLSFAAKTQFGKKHSFGGIQSYKDFTQKVPISFYNDISAQIEDLKKGVSDLFWHGDVSKFAVSAGTSGKGKHLPLTTQRLQSDRVFMRKVAKSYLRQRPNIFSLWGTHISLPGILEEKDGFEIGEISAFTAQHAPWWLRPFQLISTDELNRLPFSQKVDRIINKAAEKDVRVITAVPSWLLTIFQRLLKSTGANSIAEIWPNLQLLVCGGVKLANYRPHLEQLLGNPGIDFIETYGASEGYFSFTDDLQQNDMKLVIDNDIFYEFIPNPLPDQDSLSIQETVPLWQVETGVPYAMIVSTNAGLWRYGLNDIIKFTQTDPPRIEVLGRVSEMLDDYGEALYAYEAAQALRETTKAENMAVDAFTVGASLEKGSSVPRHFWFLQTSGPVHPDTLNRLAKNLDSILCENNRHYAIRRESDALGMPECYSITQQKISLWMEENDKNKAQGKLPAILRDESDIQFFKKM